MRPRISVSVVSHGQGPLVERLLQDLRELHLGPIEVICTINVSEPEAFLAGYEDLPLRVLRNDAPKGFGANHNQAFKISEGDVFIVVNPDIRLPDGAFMSLIQRLQGNVGVCAPQVIDSRGQIQDSVRRTPTVWRLFRRRILRDKRQDYDLEQGVLSVDWVAGMMMVFARRAFEDVGGFDESYYMYMEDADICRRLRQRGWAVLVDPGVVVIHDARRASRRNLRHMAWHLASTARFLMRRGGRSLGRAQAR